jgi:hypothetical protein
MSQPIAKATQLTQLSITTAPTGEIHVTAKDGATNLDQFLQCGSGDGAHFCLIAYDPASKNFVSFPMPDNWVSTYQIVDSVQA